MEDIFAILFLVILFSLIVWRIIKSIIKEKKEKEKLKGIPFGKRLRGKLEFDIEEVNSVVNIEYKEKFLVQILDRRMFLSESDESGYLIYFPISFCSNREISSFKNLDSFYLFKRIIDEENDGTVYTADLKNDIGLIVEVVLDIITNVFDYHRADRNLEIN
ncbi:hypothetical protein ACOSP6_16400 [Tenacibaculum sp. MEBiC06402]|uniref:hypothetical protein n=1 Tax=unclassified Tenacibaculum TaxID=2635139 RepID=UPI003B9B4EF2